MVEEIREGLRRLSGGDEESVDLWLATPQSLIDAGEVEIVLELVEHILSGAPA